jgi:hypothetical protein
MEVCVYPVINVLDIIIFLKRLTDGLCLRSQVKDPTQLGPINRVSQISGFVFIDWAKLNSQSALTETV